MANKLTIKGLGKGGQEGVTIPELMIVLIIAALIVVLALPQVISSRRLFMFAAAQREVATYLRESRQMAMSQRKQITFRFEDSTKEISIYGGTLGAAGASTNRKLSLAGMGLSASDIVFGRPTGVSTASLSDGTNLTSLSLGKLEVVFEPDGSVLDGSGNPEDKGIYLYHALYPQDTAFAISVLGSGGRVKVWRYSAGANAYVE